MPAGNTIGQAYVQILPSMNGFSKAINAQGGAEMDAAGGSAGKKFGSKLVGIAGKVIAGHRIKAQTQQNQADCRKQKKPQLPQSATSFFPIIPQPKKKASHRNTLQILNLAI